MAMEERLALRAELTELQERKRRQETWGINDLDSRVRTLKKRLGKAVWNDREEIPYVSVLVGPVAHAFAENEAASIDDSDWGDAFLAGLGGYDLCVGVAGNDVDGLVTKDLTEPQVWDDALNAVKDLESALDEVAGTLEDRGENPTRELPWGCVAIRHAATGLVLLTADAARRDARHPEPDVAIEHLVDRITKIGEELDSMDGLFWEYEGLLESQQTEVGIVLGEVVLRQRPDHIAAVIPPGTFDIWNHQMDEPLQTLHALGTYEYARRQNKAANGKDTHVRSMFEEAGASLRRIAWPLFDVGVEITDLTEPCSQREGEPNELFAARQAKQATGEHERAVLKRIKDLTIVFERPDGAPEGAILMSIENKGEPRFVRRNAHAGFRALVWDGHGQPTGIDLPKRRSGVEAWHQMGANDLLRALDIERFRELSFPSAPGGSAGELLARVDAMLHNGGRVEMRGSVLAGWIQRCGDVGTPMPTTKTLPLTFRAASKSL